MSAPVPSTPMKLAIAGKGGSGKTSITGTMARLIARDGRRVLAIDSDSNPNLALTLGLSAAQMRAISPLAADLLRRTPTGALTPHLTRSLDEIRALHAVTGADGVELLVMAQPQQADTGCLSHLHATVRSIVYVTGEAEADVCLLDTDASPEIFSRAMPQYVDAMLGVVEPYFKSLETGRRIAALARDLGIERFALVANKIRDERELELVRSFANRHGLELGGTVPFDKGFRVAEQAGRAPLDFFAPDAPSILAIDEIAHRWASAAGRGAAVTG